jgi:predicted GH43/DUF377 family glycosyl hydrolase
MSICPRPLVLLLAASTAALLGCGAGSGTQPASTGPATSPAAVASPNPGPSVPGSPGPGSFPPAVPFRFGSPEPAITTALAGLPDEKYVNPGAVIVAPDGTLHLYANVFTAWPGPVQVVHFTSSDGLAWSRVGAVPALSSASLGFADPGSDVSGGLVLADGTWVVILESVRFSGPWDLYEATAPGPDGPWTVGSTPIVSAGSDGSMDSLRWPTIVAGGPGYLLYYGVIPAGTSRGVVALATSKNGRSWDRRPDPILIPDRPFEGNAIDRPRVAATASGYVMVYSGTPITNRGEAISSDGLTWTKVGDGPVISRDRFPIDGGSWDAALFTMGDHLEYLLEIGTDGSHTADFAATTP